MNYKTHKKKKKKKKSNHPIVGLKIMISVDSSVLIPKMQVFSTACYAFFYSASLTLLHDIFIHHDQLFSPASREQKRLH